MAAPTDPADDAGTAAIDPTVAPVSVGVIGGSGLYALLDDTEVVTVDTPYGPTSAPITIGVVEGRRVAFLPRHGLQHEYPPHRVPYRANIWALRRLGVRHVFAPCASGALRPDLGPGEFVVPDQLVDRTTGRPGTFYDGPTSFHVGFADPYCDGLRAIALDACRAEGVDVRDGGTVIVVPGPRFSTRAESRWYAAMGAAVINMTQMPEAVLAAEAGLAYAAIALITDRDVGIEEDDAPPVSEAEVFAVFEANVEKVRRVLLRAVTAELPTCEHPAGPPSAFA